MSREELSPREREALVAYFGLDGEEPLDYQQCGKRMGVTRERARQSIVRGMHKLLRRIQADKWVGGAFRE